MPRRWILGGATSGQFWRNALGPTPGPAPITTIDVLIDVFPGVHSFRVVLMALALVERGSGPLGGCA